MVRHTMLTRLISANSFKTMLKITKAEGSCLNTMEQFVKSS